MPEKKLHRNSQKRIIREGEIYFVTSKTAENFPFFQEPIFCELFLEELKLVKELKGFGLLAFALNYDHFHAVVKPDFKVANISEVMKFLKKNSSINANRVLGQNNYSVDNSNNTTNENNNILTTNEGADVFPRRIDHDHFFDRKHRTETPGDEKHRRLRCAGNWQNDFDQRVVIPLRNQFLAKYGTNQNHFPIFRWQKSFHDHIIRNQKDFTHHVNYTIWNHLKHGLPENWKYTSLNYPELVDSSG